MPDVNLGNPFVNLLFGVLGTAMTLGAKVWYDSRQLKVTEEDSENKEEREYRKEVKEENELLRGRIEKLEEIHWSFRRQVEKDREDFRLKSEKERLEVEGKLVECEKHVLKLTTDYTDAKREVTLAGWKIRGLQDSVTELERRLGIQSSQGEQS